jgi:hypothetical protein
MPMVAALSSGILDEVLGINATEVDFTGLSGQLWRNND